jgi:superfamily II DNA or RNA helicase
VTPTNDDLRRQIAAEEARLADLERQRETAAQQLAALKARLDSASAVRLSAPVEPVVKTPESADEKVRLFARLFRGREQVFPVQFTSRKTLKVGYAPACSNKFVRGVCELPKIKCGECPNQAFLPVDDRVLRDHLQGRHVVGVYPLLENESCWFLAVDFDKACWKDDVAALVRVARRAGVPPSVERSRSGDGAHVWFFFREPIAAVTARQMGCALLTQAMEERHQLGMESYDRLFPNQDTMPKGGFGNLIALPLQYEARKAGNTVFVDDAFQPYPDQWAYLAAVPRVASATVHGIAADAVRRGAVVGVRAVEDAGDEEPWKRRPPGTSQRLRISEALPSSVLAVLAQRLFVEKEGLPSPLINAIKRLAAFQNPEFYKKQNLRLSTALTPRVVSCADELGRHVSLPRGCLLALEALLRENGVALRLTDEREEAPSDERRFVGDLTVPQREAVEALLAHDIGLFVAPPGSGKTVVGAYLVAARTRRTLVLVHRQPLLEQWVAQLALFLGIEEKDIGRIGAGRRKPNGQLDVAMVQSLVRKGSVDEIVSSYAQVIVDECHHVPAVSFERVLSEVRARYVVGLTATRERRDGHHPIAEMQLGPVRFSVDGKGRPLEHALVVRETAFRSEQGDKVAIQDLYRELAVDSARNTMILNDVIAAVSEGRSPIVLTERRDHLEFFADKLRAFVRHLVVLQGGMSAKDRRAASRQLAEIPADHERLVVATGRYVGEGFDDTRLDTLFLALPVSWKGTLTQYAGRLHRLHPSKKDVRIYDYVDRAVPMLARMFEKRRRAYAAIGYQIEGAGLPRTERSLTIDYRDI